MQSTMNNIETKESSFLMKTPKWLLTGLLLLTLTACGSNSNNGAATVKETAIEKIADYAQNGGVAPTLQDYLDAGITGVNTANITEINTAIEQLIHDDVDTEAEIQALADSLGVGFLDAPSLANAAEQVYNENEAIAALSFNNIGGDTLTSCIADTLPAGLIVATSTDSSTCEITGTPTTVQSVTIHTIIATNATGSDTATVSIEVKVSVPILALPALDNVTAQIYTKDVAIATFVFNNSGGEELTNCSADSLPTGLSVTKSADNKTCEISGIPTAVQIATIHTITATNATGSNTATVSIEVIKISVPILALPALDNATAQVYTKDVAIATFVFNNSGGKELTNCSADSLPAGLSVAKSADNKTCEISGTPTAVQVATIHTITATNVTGSNTAMVSIEVKVVVPNIAPTANPDTISAVENIAITYDILTNDTDTDGSLDKTSVSINTPVSHGSTIINPISGEVTYTPATDYSGADSFAYTVEDNGGLVSNEVTVSIEVDVDTDGDGIGNKLDLDDDGDGFSDVDELAASTDPLDPNSKPTTPPPSGAAFKIKIKSNIFYINTWDRDGYSYNVDCDNDGIDEAVAQTKGYLCQYPTDDEYIVSITGIFPYFSASGGFRFVGNKEKLISIEQWGTGEWLSFGSSFSGAINMRLNATDNPNLTKVTSMAGMFRELKSFNGDISNWDVSNVTNMDEMFAGSSSFNADLGSWNVSKVTSMRRMFFGASSFNQDISGWDVGNVTTMTGMFGEASLFNSNIGSWNVSNVENMSSMFVAPFPLPPTIGISRFNQDISGWDVGKVTNMSSMFRGANEFNKNINAWNVRNVVDMSEMFKSATSFNQSLDKWNVSSVNNMGAMFSDASAFNQDISSWNVRAATTLGGMFNGASSNFDQDLGSWDVSNASYLGDMFNFLSVGNYNSVLENWSSLLSLKPNVIFGCKNCVYSGFAAKDARDFLTTDVNGPMWTIRDAGPQ